MCVTCVWAGVDSVREQKKLEARKMLENAAESHTSGARFVRHGRTWRLADCKKTCRQLDYILQRTLTFTKTQKMLTYNTLTIQRPETNWLKRRFCKTWLCLKPTTPTKLTKFYKLNLPETLLQKTRQFREPTKLTTNKTKAAKQSQSKLTLTETKAEKTWR